MTHTAKCAAWRVSYEAYVAKYPGHCKSCGGSGETSVGAEVDLCVYCLEHWRCPLCMTPTKKVKRGEHGAEADYGKCEACGWGEWESIHDKASSPFVPPVECHCEDDGQPWGQS